MIDKFFIIDNNEERQKQIQVYKKAIKKLKIKKIKQNNILIIKHIEDTAKFFKIQVLKIKINKSFFDIETIGQYKNTINFLIYLEKNMQIKSLQIYKENKNFILQGVFKFKILHKKQKMNTIDNMPNPFNKIKRKAKRKIKPQKKKLKLVAIFDQEICLNDKWYKKGEKIGKYKIKNIFKDYVELEEKNKIIKVKISSEK